MSEERGRAVERAEARRQQILAAAQTCFRRSGFHGASMAEICRTAGMSAGHVYNYFGGKDEIIAAIVERNLEDLLQRLARFTDHLDVTEALIDGARDALVAKLQPEHRDLQLEIVATAVRNPHLAERLTATASIAHASFTALLAGSAQRAAPEVSLDVRATLVGALFDGLMMRSVIQPDLDVDALWPLFQRLLRVIFDAPDGGGGRGPG